MNERGQCAIVYIDLRNVPVGVRGVLGRGAGKICPKAIAVVRREGDSPLSDHHLGSGITLGLGTTIPATVPSHSLDTRELGL